MTSCTVNRRVGVVSSSPFSSEGNATLASTHVRDPSCGRRAGSRIGTAIRAGNDAGRVGVAGFARPGSSERLPPDFPGAQGVPFSQTSIWVDATPG